MKSREARYAGWMEHLREATYTDARSPGSALTGAPLGVGSLLSGRYRISRFVAAGGMGEVYEAADQLLGEPVALKLLRADLLRKRGAQERFAEEFLLARRVTHPNVCRVFEVGVEGERLFYTMKLYGGQTLKARLAANGPHTIDAARPLVAQMLAGIAAAHAVDVVHADLKPSNVIVDDRDRVVITDFGLAQPLCATIGCPCDQPHLVGTPAYMAPEQVTGKDMVHEGTDLFSFGVITFELLTGKLPWNGTNVTALANARLSGPTPSPLALRPDLDPAWDEVIRACLARDKRDRPACVGDVARALGV
jgi:serine/threonine-protein kinase